MNIQEFIEKYYLHDSLVTNIVHFFEDETVSISVEFCYWLQKEYDENDPETGMLQFKFYNVTEFFYDGVTGDIDYFSILDTTVNDNTIIFNILDDFNDLYYTLKITADFVEVYRGKEKGLNNDSK